MKYVVTPLIAWLAPSSIGVSVSSNPAELNGLLSTGVMDGRRYGRVLHQGWQTRGPGIDRRHMRRGEESSAFRISLAGAQEKTAFTRIGGRWCRPIDATPSTHIFKLPLGVIANTSRVDMFDSVANECLCAQIIEALDLPMAHSPTIRRNVAATTRPGRRCRTWDC